MTAPDATASSEAAAGPSRKVILRLDGVHTYYGHIHALHGISLDVANGEIVTLIGANGAGKTTTLKTISGLLHPRTGRVTLEDRDVSRTPAHELVRQGIGQALVRAIERQLGHEGLRYLFVMTLHPEDPYEPYQRTRAFYERVGFELALSRDPPGASPNPLAYYLKPL